MRNGTKKWILRQAMYDVLPPVVAQRCDKGDFSSYLHQGVVEAIDRLGGVDNLDRLVGVQRGYLDRDGVALLARRSLDCARYGRPVRERVDEIANLWAVLATDLFLAVHSGSGPDGSGLDATPEPPIVGRLRCAPGLMERAATPRC
jgi:Asparagine synthase